MEEINYINCHNKCEILPSKGKNSQVEFENQIHYILLSGKGLSKMTHLKQGNLRTVYSGSWVGNGRSTRRGVITG